MTKGLLSIMAVVTLTCGPVQAKEGGDQSQNGAESWLAGVIPPSGSYFTNYLGNYSGYLQNGSGNKVRLRGGDIRADVTFDALRYISVTNTTIFGAIYGWAAIVPVVDLSIDFAGSTSGRNGIGDVVITPVILAWHSSEWHYATGVDVFLPTGAFNKAAAPGKNIGANYYGFEPIFVVTYLDREGWEVSGKFMYNWKTKNKDTNYHSGAEVHMDYLVGKHFGPWSAGVDGYYLQQITDDKLAGVSVGSDGNRGQVFAIGPSIKFENSVHSQLIVQWQHESDVKNRFQGDKLWFKFITAI